MVLWDEVAKDIAKEFPDVTVDKMLVDAMTTRMVLKPESIDTIVATNLVCFDFDHNFLLFAFYMQLSLYGKKTLQVRND